MLGVPIWVAHRSCSKVLLQRPTCTLELHLHDAQHFLWRVGLCVVHLSQKFWWLLHELLKSNLQAGWVLEDPAKSKEGSLECSMECSMLFLVSLQDSELLHRLNEGQCCKS